MKYVIDDISKKVVKYGAFVNEPSMMVGQTCIETEKMPTVPTDKQDVYWNEAILDFQQTAP